VFGIFLPKTDFGQGIPDFDSVRLFAFLLLLFLSIEIAIYKKLKVLNPWVLILFLFSLFVFASVLWSAESYTFSFFQEYFDWIFIRLIIAIVGINVFQHYENIKKFIKHMAFGVSIMAMIGILQFFLGLTEATGTVRAYGTFGGPNGFAVFLVLSVPFFLFALKENIVSKRIGFFAIVLAILGVLSTVSRKGALGLMLSFLIYFLIQKEFRKFYMLLIIGFFCGVTIFSTQFIQQRFERFHQAELEKQIASRARMAYAGVEMFMESPLIGLGYKGYNRNFGRFFPGSNRKNYDAHNEFCMIFLYPVQRSINRLRGFRQGRVSEVGKNIAAACLAATIPLMVSFYFSGAMFYVNPYVTSLFYSLITISFFNQKKASDNDSK